MLYLFSGDYNLGFRGIAIGVHISRLPMGSVRERQKSQRKKSYGGTICGTVVC